MNSVQTGQYRHFKGKIYEVINTAKDKDTLEDFVIYRACYSSPEFKDGQLRIRPQKMFLETVIVDGKEIPRFTFLEDTH
jgi:hypothetical protein